MTFLMACTAKVIIVAACCGSYFTGCSGPILEARPIPGYDRYEFLVRLKCPYGRHDYVMGQPHEVETRLLEWMDSRQLREVKE